MYLHLGKDVVVAKASILAIFDLDNASYSHITRDYLARAEKGGSVVNVSDELPKSFVLCQGAGGRQTVYLSQLAAGTLLRRSELISID